MVMLWADSLNVAHVTVLIPRKKKIPRDFENIKWRPLLIESVFAQTAHVLFAVRQQTI